MSRRLVPTRRPAGGPVLTALAVAAALTAAACGSSAGTSTATTAATAKAAAAATTTAKATANTGTATANTTKESSMKPTVSVPTGTAPTALVKEDLVVGTGAEAVKGKTVSVQYVGVHYTDGTQFDASWDRGEPFEFKLGAGMVIAGWDQGVEGMKVGGRRQLVIPSDLGYGARGAPPVIKANETLVFVVDLLGVR